MKKTIIVSGSWGKPKEKVVYAAGDNSLNVSKKEFHYPISAYLENNAKSEDEIKLILLVKKDPCGYYKKNISNFEEEIEEINKTIKAKIEIKKVVSEFTEDFMVLRNTLDAVIDEIDNNSLIYCDVTFGDKSNIVIMFSALSFAESFLGGMVGRILYGKADFSDEGKPINTVAWDLTPLYSIHSITNKLTCDNPEKARRVLKELLTM